jgi:flagellar hook-length control protein FliK
MTNQTNLDYLFKLTSPLMERSGSGSTSAPDRRPAFDDHLVNASASASGSSTAAGVRTQSSASAPAASDAAANGAYSDHDSAASDSQPAEDSTSVDSAASDDAKTTPVDDTHDGAGETSQNADEESAGDVATNDDEDNSEQDAAEEIATAASLARQATALRDEQPTLADDQVSATAKGDAQDAQSLATSPSGNFDDRAGRRTGDLPEVELHSADLTSENVTAHLETNESTTPTAVGKRTKRSNSAKATGDLSQNESAPKKHDENISASADGTVGNAENAINGVKLKSDKATSAGRRSARESEKLSDDSARVAASRPTQLGEASASQDQSSTFAVANGVSAQGANLITKTESGEEARQAIKSVSHANEGIHMTGRAQRAGSTAKGRTHAASGELPRVDAARFVGRVAKAVQTAQERGGLVQLRLSPPELGSLRLELSMQNGVMTATVETETPAARQILLDHLPALRDRLAEQNIRIERFDVDVRQDNSGGQADPRASQQEHRQQQPQQPNPRHPGGRPAATHSPTSDAPHALSRLTNSELNVLA